jgi:hypothetical protein
MKTLILLALILSSAPSFAKPIEVALMCRLVTEDSAMVMVDGANYEGHIAFNRSMGFMACPFDLKERITASQPFKCAGLWDDDEPRGTDTVVVVDFKSTEIGWTATFQTNNQYGRRTVTVQCI